MSLSLSEVVSVVEQVSATSGRNGKRDLIAALLRRAETEEIGLVTAWLGGSLRQRRTGVGWRSLAELPAPAETPGLSVLEVDVTLDELERDHGPGSQTRRRERLAALLGAATAAEQSFLRGLLTGELRQGALAGVVLDAVARAHEVPVAVVRRAAMLGGSLAAVAVAARQGGEAALAAFGLELMRPLQPMLASSAPDVETATGATAPPWLVDAKLDGIRIQVHRDGETVRVWSRSLDEITDRLPEVVASVRAMPGERLVLDGEALAVDADGRAVAFQDSASLAARHQRTPGVAAATRTVASDAAAASPGTSREGGSADGGTGGDPVAEAGSSEGGAVEGGAVEGGLGCWFFDLLHRDGVDLLDAPATERAEQLAAVAGELVVPRLLTDDPEAVSDFNAEALAAGHEGVVVKSADGVWEAGRRGKGWVKVKPRLTLDLVVLAVEPGSGRRQGKLSNIHLGARDGDGFVMLGKTFKGMTDEMLAWQTERFTALTADSSPWVVESGRQVVPLRPEQVVEIAFDGLQRSTRYPAGLALRFARVLRYRPDKSAAEADTLTTVRALAARA